MGTYNRQKRRLLHSKSVRIDVKEIKRAVGDVQSALGAGAFAVAFDGAQKLCEWIGAVVDGDGANSPMGIDVATLDNIYMTALVWCVRAKSGLGDRASAEAMAEAYYKAACDRGCAPRIVQALQIKAQFALDRADWLAAIDALESIFPYAEALGDRGVEIAAGLALANCHTRLYRFNDASEALVRAEKCAAMADGALDENLPAIWMGLYEIEKLTGQCEAARSCLSRLGEWIQNGRACREDDFCAFLLAQIRESSAQFDSQNVRDILDMLKSTSIYRAANGGESPDAKRQKLQHIIVDIEDCRSLWASGEREGARRVYDRCVAATDDRATQQTLALLRYEWAVETGRCAPTSAQQCHENDDDPEAMAHEMARLFDEDSREGDGNILMQIHRGFIDAELEMERGKYEESSQILNWIHEVATFRDCASIAVRARAMLCQNEICKGNARGVATESVEVYGAMRRYIGEIEALPAFLIAYRLCLMVGDESPLEALCCVNDVFERCEQKFETCCVQHGEPGMVALGLGLLRIYALKRDVARFEKVAAVLAPAMDPARRAHRTMVYWGICAEFERSRGDGASRAAGYLKKMRELAEINGFDASRI